MVQVTLGYNYTNYGNTKDISKGKGYNGETKDQTGLIYLRARYYDPTTARFISIDNNYTGEKEQVNTQNRYNYGLGNPYKYVDRDGNTPVDPNSPNNNSAYMSDEAVDLYIKNKKCKTEAEVKKAITACGLDPAKGRGKQALERWKKKNKPGKEPQQPKTKEPPKQTPNVGTSSYQEQIKTPNKKDDPATITTCPSDISAQLSNVDKYKKMREYLYNDPYFSTSEALSSVGYSSKNTDGAIKPFLAKAAKTYAGVKHLLSFGVWKENEVYAIVRKEANALKSASGNADLAKEYVTEVCKNLDSMRLGIINLQGPYRMISELVSGNGMYDKGSSPQYIYIKRILHYKNQKFQYLYSHDVQFLMKTSYYISYYIDEITLINSLLFGYITGGTISADDIMSYAMNKAQVSLPDPWLE